MVRVSLRLIILEFLELYPLVTVSSFSNTLPIPLQKKQVIMNFHCLPKSDLSALSVKYIDCISDEE